MVRPEAISSVFPTAVEINTLCDQLGADPGLRARAHDYHGRALVAGVDPADILRILREKIQRAQNENAT